MRGLVGGSGRSGLGDGLDLAVDRRQGDARGLEDFARRPAERRAHDDALALVAELDLLDAVEIGADVGPFELGVLRRETVGEVLLEHQRQERAKHVAADGLVALVEDRPRAEDVLGGAEDLLDAPELLVAQHGGERVEGGVGAQNEDAVELFVFGDLGLVDGRAPRPPRAGPDCG